MCSGDSLSPGPLLISVSPPRFSEPEREGLKPPGYRDSDSGQEEARTTGNVSQETIGPGWEGDFSFPSSSLLVQVSIREKERQDYYYSSKQAGKNKDDHMGKPGAFPYLFQDIVSDSASMKPTLAGWAGGLPYTPSQQLEEGTAQTRVTFHSLHSLQVT